MHFSIIVVVVLALSILIAGVLSIFRFHQIRDIYRPFIYLTWITCITEVLSTFLFLNRHFTIVPYTIYSLFESLFLLWFFHGLGILKKGVWLYSFVALFITGWFVESFLIQRFGSHFTFYFNAVYGFVVVLLSIRTINDLLFTEKDLLKNPTFLICIGLLIFFTYDTINRVFRLYGLNESDAFKRGLESLQMIINCLSNLIYALAVLWMRKRKPFALQFGTFNEQNIQQTNTG